MKINNLKALTDLISSNVSDKTQKTLTEFAWKKYGQKASVCVVNGEEDLLSFKVTNGGPTGTISIDENEGKMIRNQVVVWALTRYGLPSPDREDDIPHIVLLPTPSLATSLGPKKFAKFIQNWKGDSKVGEVTVVTYSVLS